MNCPRCQRENGLGAKFCEACGTPLARSCPSCQTLVPTSAKFCPECAHPFPGSAADARFGSPRTYTPEYLGERILASRAALEGERKLVTVLFADLKGSTELLADR